MNLLKFQKLSLGLLLLLSMLCLTTQGQQSLKTSLTSTEDARVARLIGLAKVWGTVKYFHPYLAYRDIDWDKALVETIPKVNTAKTQEEYLAAINQMLAALNDRSTRAEIQTEMKMTPTTQPVEVVVKKPVRTETGVLVIDLASIARSLAKDVTARGGFLKDTTQALPTAKAIIIDARGTRKTEDDEDYVGGFLRQILSTMLDAEVVLGSTRYRIHNGYASQTSRESEYYHSGFNSSAPKIILGRSKTKTPPILFIINENSPNLTDILGGMQSANRAVVIQEGEPAPIADGGNFTIALPDNIQVRMRTGEVINPNGSIDLQADMVVTPSSTDDVAMKEALRAIAENKVSPLVMRPASTFAAQINQKDKMYPEMQFPSVEYRLLALFRFWNVINYFYPYRKLIEDTWQTVLPRYIPKFEANKDVTDYQLTALELVTEMHDSHGGLQNANAAMEKLGLFQPLILTNQIENQAVVTKVIDDKLPIKAGEIILTVDGEPVEKAVALQSRFIPASTPQSLVNRAYSSVLLGPKDSIAKLRVRGSGGEIREVGLARSTSIMEPTLYAAMERSTPVVQVLPSGFGYVDLARLQAAEVDKMFDTIKSTPAVIFDMRGYPNGTAWLIAPRLTEKKNVIGALFSRPLLEGLTLSYSFADNMSYSFAQKLPEAKGSVYKGKVVMLINEEAISQAEHTCLFFEAATDVTFIGTPTTGANGDITFMVLPGNLSASFTGHDVRHADGRQLQRVGILPDIRVAPTIRGTRDGRDEVLEAAVKYLDRSKLPKEMSR